MVCFWTESWPRPIHAADSRRESTAGKYTRMDDGLYKYMVALMEEDKVLSDLREFTMGVPGSHMQSPPEQGKLLSLLVKVMGAKNALEVGVFTGYSSLSIAKSLPEDGKLYAFEKDADKLDIARRYWKEAKVDHKIVSIEGDAKENLPKLIADGLSGLFDFAFIDANKRPQGTYFEQCLKLVKPKGLIVMDNVFFYGKVLDGQANDNITNSIREMNETLKRDPRVDLTVLPVGDGIAICRVL